MIFYKCLVIGEVYIIANFLFFFKNLKKKILVDPKHTVKQKGPSRGDIPTPKRTSIISGT